MKVALVAVMDNGNTLRHLARGLRDYCDTDATLYMLGDDTHVNIPDETVVQVPYLAPYKPDWGFFRDGTDLSPDVLITNDHTWFQHHERLLHEADATLVKCNGTFARKYGPWFEADRLRHGTTYITSPTDYTLASSLGFSIQTLGPLIDHRLLPAPAQPKDTIIVGHCPTGPTKGTKQIIRALQPHRQAGTIEIDLVTGKTWTQCVERKARHHIHIDQWNNWGAFGINTIEALALGSLAINAPLHPYVTMHLGPAVDMPIIHLPELTRAIDVAITLTKNHYNYASDREWALTHFDIEHQAPRWHQLIEALVNQT